MSLSAGSKLLVETGECAVLKRVPFVICLGEVTYSYISKRYPTVHHIMNRRLRDRQLLSLIGVSRCIGPNWVRVIFFCYTLGWNQTQFPKCSKYQTMEKVQKLTNTNKLAYSHLCLWATKC